MDIRSWDITQRIQFTIPPTTVSGSDVMPFVFKLSNSIGTSDYDLSYIFDALGENGVSVANRKKVLFTQVIDGQEQPLYCELDSWDAIAELAYFWVKPLVLSSTYINIFYFYYDKTKEDNTKYLSETNELSLSLFMDLAQEGYSDLNGTLAIDLIKVGSLYKFWYLGWHEGNGRWTIMYCDSTDFVTWENHQTVVNHSHTYDSKSHHPGSVIYDESTGVYKMWYSGDDNNKYRILYCDSIDGVTWDNFQMVVDTGNTPYDPSYSVCCTVLKEGNTYKMWYAGFYGSPAAYRIHYCESQDGLTWAYHQMIVDDCLSILYNGYPYLRPCKVLFKDGLYHMWLEVHDGDAWLAYYCNSTNGIYWENFKSFTKLNSLGTYDTVHSGLFLTVTELDGEYHFFYGGSDGLSWRIITSRSVSLTGQRTPSQEVWSDFISVHHLNSSYGYIDSTSNRLNMVSSNNILPVAGAIGSSAVEFLDDTSYINLGSDSYFDFSLPTTIILHGKVSAGRQLIYRGQYPDSCYQLYYQDEEDILNLEFNTSTGVQVVTSESTTPSDIWETITVRRSNDPGINTSLHVPPKILPDTKTNDVLNTDQSFYIGYSSDSVQGEFDEIWVASTFHTRETLAFLDKNLMDNVIQISTGYVQGYTTKYGKAVGTQVLAYDIVNKSLLGVADTDPETGAYYIEVPTQDECFLVAIDGGLYNHFILGKVIPFLT